MSRQSAQRALTIPQRLAAALATPEVEIRGAFKSAAKRSLKDGAFVVVPTMSVREPQERRESREVQLRDLVAQSHPDAASAARLAQIRFSSGDPLAALAIADVSLRKMLQITRQLKLDYLWLVDDHTTMYLTETCQKVPRETFTDEAAGELGTTLSDVVKESVGEVEWLTSLPRWTTASRSGWVRGGPLQLCCEDCSREIQWADWWHADATRMKNNAFVYCPHHGGPITTHRGRRLRAFVHARQQVDGAVWNQDEMADQLSVYTFELRGLGPNAMYVGQTGKSPEEHYEDHAALGDLAARVLKSRRAQIGPLRPDRLPELPSLHGRQAALAAEHWTSLWLILQGVDVHGDGAR